MEVRWIVHGSSVGEGENHRASVKQYCIIQVMSSLLSSLLMVCILCLHLMITLQGSGIQPQESVKQS